MQERHGSGEQPSGEYLTIQELSTWLNISRGSAWSLVMERGGIPHYRFTDPHVAVCGLHRSRNLTATLTLSPELSQSGPHAQSLL